MTSVHDKPTRYLGCGSAFAEALRYTDVSPNLLPILRGFTLGYAIFDILYLTTKYINNPKKALCSGTDALLWQMCASIIMPTLAINRICLLTIYACRSLRIQRSLKMSLVTGTGCAFIPIITDPIDLATETLLNNTFRKWTK